MTLLLMLACFANQVADAYANKDIERLRAAYVDAPTRGDSLLVLYRLYPLVNEAELIDDLPSKLEDGTGREKAILAALWAFRMADGGLFSKMTHAGRWYELMTQARKDAPFDAFVRLIYAQSVYYMPRYFGGGKKRSIAFLKLLREQLATEPQCGLGTLEVDVWIGVALGQVNDPSAQEVRHRLLSQDLPPLFLELLQDPS